MHYERYLDDPAGALTQTQPGLLAYYARLCLARKSGNIPINSWVSRKSSGNGVATGTG